MYGRTQFKMKLDQSLFNGLFGKFEMEELFRIFMEKCLDKKGTVALYLVLTISEMQECLNIFDEYHSGMGIYYLGTLIQRGNVVTNDTFGTPRYVYGILPPPELMEKI